MKICIIANRDKDKELQVSNEICSLFKGYDIDCFICETVIKNGKHYTDPLYVKDADIAIVIGGDGTLIQAARDLNELDISFIGVNLGTLGYLTEISVNDISDMARKIASGDYYLENRMMIAGTVIRDNKVICENFALNDAVIYKNGYGQMVSVDVLVNDQLLSEYDADGMLIATPTGSTAYNLSAGGPLIVPSADMMVLTPICAHILNARSVVIPADSTVQIIIRRRKTEDKEHELHFDGADVIGVAPGDKIIIKKMDHHTKLIRMSSTSFYKVLQKKLQNIQ